MGRMETLSRTPEELNAPQDLECIIKPKERDKNNLDTREIGPESDLCQELKLKAALCDETASKTTKSQKVMQLTRKIRKLLHKYNRKVDKSQNETEIAFVTALLQSHCDGKKSPILQSLVETPLDEKSLVVDESPLVERSPMRVSMHHPCPEPYPPQQRSYNYNGGMRVEEADEPPLTSLEDFLAYLTPQEVLQLTKAVDQVVTQEDSRGTFYQNEPWQVQNEVNDWATQLPPHQQYRPNINQNINEWEDARHEAQNVFREPRLSFSSTSSNSPYSESPSSSPGSSPYASVNSPASTVDLNFDGCMIPTTVATIDQLEGSKASPSLSPVPALAEEVSRRDPLTPSTKTAMPTPAKDAIAEKLNLTKKEEAWVRIQEPSIDQLGMGDYDGDSQLMILLARKASWCLEYAYCIVERLLKEQPLYLTETNKHEKDALHIAAEDLRTEPAMAAYIAEALARAELPVQKVYTDGETLLHKLARLGDDYAAVVKSLLEVKLSSGATAFDVNARNKDGLTPLHVACYCHRPGEVETSLVVQVLLEADVDLLAQDYVDKNTPLHHLVNVSADLRLVNVFFTHLGRRDLLQQAAEVVNRQKNTVLHLACGKNSLSEGDHCRLVQTVVNHGGQIHLKNNNGQVPSYLVEANRKPEIKAILHAKIGKGK